MLFYGAILGVAAKCISGMCLSDFIDSKLVYYRRFNINLKLYFIFTDGAELLLDLGCSPSLIGKRPSQFCEVYM